ncbi:hypothetical protein ACWGCC_04585 [Streptomyces nigrescens]
MTGRLRGTLGLPVAPPLGTVTDALRAARGCLSATRSPHPVALWQLAAVLGHACGPGPFEARPGGRTGLRYADADGVRLTAGTNAPIPPGGYRYDLVAHALVPYGRPGSPHDADLALRLPGGDRSAVARVQLVAAASGLCARTGPGGPDTLFLHAPSAARAPAPAPPGTGLADALAALPAEPPAYLPTPAPLTAEELHALLGAAAPVPPYWVSVRCVDGVAPGVYRADGADGAFNAVWHGHTAPLAHVLTRGGHAAAAALADAAATVHLAGSGQGPVTEALRLQTAVTGRGLTAWCDDRPAPAAAPLLGMGPGGDEVVCHVTLGRARPEPRIRIPLALPGLP